MKNFFMFLVAIILCCGTTLSAAPDENKINQGLNQFIEDLAVTAPNTAINQNVYADAYIGKLIPSVPPHFAIGVNSAFAILDMSGLKTAANGMGLKLDIPDKFTLPSFTLDARIGGLFLPFDIGLTFMKIPSTDLEGIKVDYLTWGADLRWALMQQSVIKPNISLGVGYYQSSGNIKTSSDKTNASISYKTNALAISAQVSKTFVIVTPFIGGRFVMSDADSSYDWSATVASITKSGNGAYTKEFGHLNQFNLYGGLSVNIFIVRLTPSVSYDFTNEIFTGSFSARIQL